MQSDTGKYIIIAGVVIVLLGLIIYFFHLFLFYCLLAKCNSPINIPVVDIFIMAHFMIITLDREAARRYQDREGKFPFLLSHHHHDFIKRICQPVYMGLKKIF